MNLVVLIVIGIIIADLVVHGDQTNKLLGTMGTIWSTSVKGMLGQT